jgi:hypothetical protein
MQKFKLKVAVKLFFQGSFWMVSLSRRFCPNTFFVDKMSKYFELLKFCMLNKINKLLEITTPTYSNEMPLLYLTADV